MRSNTHEKAFMFASDIQLDFITPTDAIRDHYIDSARSPDPGYLLPFLFEYQEGTQASCSTAHPLTRVPRMARRRLRTTFADGRRYRGFSPPERSIIRHNSDVTGAADGFPAKLANPARVSVFDTRVATIAQFGPLSIFIMPSDRRICSVAHPYPP